MLSGSFIVDAPQGIADTKNSESWSLSWKSSGSLATEKLLMWGNQNKHAWCQCYHSHEVRLDYKTGRCCPCPSSFYIIFLSSDSSILSWFWLPLLILRSIVSNSRFSTEFQTYTSNCQQDISTWGSPINMSRTKLILLLSWPAFQPVSSLWVDGTVAQLARSHGVALTHPCLLFPVIH